MLRYKKVVTTKVIADYFWRVTVEICGVIKNNKLAIFSKLSFFFKILEGCERRIRGDAQKLLTSLDSEYSN